MTCGIRIAHQPIPDHYLDKLAKFCRNNQTQVDLIIGKNMKKSDTGKFQTFLLNSCELHITYG